jgi:hypothetical protein
MGWSLLGKVHQEEGRNVGQAHCPEEMRNVSDNGNQEGTSKGCGTILDVTRKADASSSGMEACNEAPVSQSRRRPPHDDDAV